MLVAVAAFLMFAAGAAFLEGVVWLIIRIVKGDALLAPIIVIVCGLLVAGGSFLGIRISDARSAEASELASDTYSQPEPAITPTPELDSQPESELDLDPDTQPESDTQLDLDTQQIPEAEIQPPDIYDDTEPEPESEPEPDPTPEPTRTPRPTPTPTPTPPLSTMLDDIREELAEAYGRNYRVTEDSDGTILINVWGEDIAQLSYVAQLGSADLIESWNSMVDSVIQADTVYQSMVDYYGKTIIYNVLNNLNFRETLLTVQNGRVLYDSVDEALKKAQEQTGSSDVEVDPYVLYQQNPKQALELYPEIAVDIDPEELYALNPDLAEYYYPELFGDH